MTEVVSVLDRGVRLDLPFDACILYHGRDSIGGLALGFRLMAHALRVLTPEAPPERSDIVFRTGFPGPGVRDAVEMTTRAVTRGEWHVIENPPENAPEGVYGRMYFEVSIGNKTAAVRLADGALPEDFVRTGRRVVGGERSPELLAHWEACKAGLAQAVLAADPDQLFVTVVR